MYTSRGTLVFQWFVARAHSTSPRKIYASPAVTATGPSARRYHLCVAAPAFRGGKANCRAFSAGHAATQIMQALHSAERICTSLSTGKLAGHALAHFAQSMQASESRRIFTGLNREVSPSSAP